MKKFEIVHTIEVEKSKNAGEKIIIKNKFAEAEIYLLGGHLTHFQPKGEEKVIFDGKESYILPPKSAHFGIPICWPWFGPHPDDNSKPQHGFARNMLWTLTETVILNNGYTQVTLSLQETEKTLLLWPHTFKLDLIFTIGKTLQVKLITYNTSDKNMMITQALHSYFYIEDITNIEIKGVENTTFIDQLDENKVKIETSALQFTQKLDRIYIPTTSTCEIADPLLKRKLIIEKEHSNTTTIWNPWEENGLHDLPNEKYKKFVCIEAVNAKEDSQILQPGQTYSLSQNISVESL